MNQILGTTAHHLAAAPGKKGLFPYRYVSRGPDRKRPAFNMLSLSEHVWGIFMIMREKKISPDTKVSLYKHVQNIIEDTCSFDWATAVWPWSEEIFSQVDEGRLRWSDSADIQMLRMSMSRTSTAKIDFSASSSSKAHPQNDNKPNQPHDRYPTNKFRQGQHSNATEIYKGGPPCEQYAPQGCSLPSGHIIKGQKMIHVCRHCLLYTSAAHQHSEINCRN